MNATKLITAIAAIAIAATISACGTGQPVDPSPTPTVTASATPTSEETASTPAQTTPPPSVPTEPGATVPADQIEQARDAGAKVYVSPNGDGSGVVVGDGSYEAIIADAAPIPGTVSGLDTLRQQGEMLNDLALATDEAGVGVIFIIAAGKVSVDSFVQDGYTAFGNNVASAFAPVSGSKSAVLGAAQAFAAANPGTTVIDLTD